MSATRTHSDERGPTDEQASGVGTAPNARTGRAAPALAWSFANTAASRIGTLAIGIVLARLLGPQEFGTFAVAMVALAAVLSFNELGISLAIVRWPIDPRTIAPSVATMSVASSAIVTVAMVLGAPAFADAMGAPEAAPLVQLLSVCVLVNGIVATPAALMQREFQQRRRTLIDQVNVWVGALVSVGLALAGTGALALVVGRLTGALVSGVLFIVMSPIPLRFGLDRTQGRALLAFGVPLAGASLIVFAAGYVDQVVVGRLLGPVALGAYVLAFNLASWPVTMFSQPLRAVAPAMFSRLQHRPDVMTDVFARIVRPLLAMAVPVCVVLSVAAPDVVRLVYGAQWSQAAEPLRWLALLAAGRIVIELAYDFLVVVGRSRALLVAQAVWFVALLPAVWVGAERGSLGGAGLAQVIVVGVVVLPLYIALLARAGIPVRVVLVRTAPSVAAGSLLYVVGALLVGAFTSSLLTVMLIAVLGGAVGLLLLRLSWGDVAVVRVASETYA